MAIPIINDWEKYFTESHEGLGSSYERIVLNELLNKIADKYMLHSSLETPSFGFTGTSGINLMGLAKRDVSVNLEDHNAHRLERIINLWQELGLKLTARVNSDYLKLDYPDNSFDLGFNFSALWFTKDLKVFLQELCRVCRKAILLCVPNRNGIGYKMQIKDYSSIKYPMLKPEQIDPHTIIHLMRKNGWQLQDKKYIDCPPWPDIGMNKELFLGKLLHRQQLTSTKTKKPVSILPYYLGEDPDFRTRMLRYSIIERTAPQCFKSIWAHHYYLLFLAP